MTIIKFTILIFLKMAQESSLNLEGETIFIEDSRKVLKLHHV